MSKLNPLVYVSYFFQNNYGSTGVGYKCITVKGSISSFSDIHEIEKEILKDDDFETVVLLHWQRLE